MGCRSSHGSPWSICISLKFVKRLPQFFLWGSQHKQNFVWLLCSVIYGLTATSAHWSALCPETMKSSVPVSIPCPLFTEVEGDTYRLDAFRDSAGTRQNGDVDAIDGEIKQMDKRIRMKLTLLDKLFNTCHGCPGYRVSREVSWCSQTIALSQRNNNNKTPLAAFTQGICVSLNACELCENCAETAVSIRSTKH